MTYRLQGVFTAIADPNRRLMLDYLASGELSAGALAEKFNMSRPAVVRHLRVLEKNGLVDIEQRGRHRIHKLNPTPLADVRAWLQRYGRFWDDKLQNLKSQVESE